MKLPVTPYRFEIDTPNGTAVIDIEPTQFDRAEPCKFNFEKSAPRSVLPVHDYLVHHGIGMMGYAFDVPGYVAPVDLNRSLLLNDSYLKDHERNDPNILGFRIADGYIPPDDWTFDPDAVEDDDWLDDDEEEDIQMTNADGSPWYPSQRQPVYESIVQANQSPTVSQDQSSKAMKFTLDTQSNTMEGLHRSDVGWVAFLWGNPGTSPLFADGDGLARIIAQQDWERKYLPSEPSGRDICMRLVDIAARGRVKRRYGTSTHPKIDITWQGEIAVLQWSVGRNTWYLYAYRKDWTGSK
ncbi:hypothetical protein [Desulfatirhabdium butyrativorans]|uniref:hypothetical protein n=1 Tax=Desulfatirhabdium butyrativorans TaxID=340467 RepID=UPI000409861E|nr:hypothetical protein [Desulfatirhabdium butyrativorans]